MHKCNLLKMPFRGMGNKYLLDELAQSGQWHALYFHQLPVRKHIVFNRIQSSELKVFHLTTT